MSYLYADFSHADTSVGNLVTIRADAWADCS